MWGVEKFEQSLQMVKDAIGNRKISGGFSLSRVTNWVTFGRRLQQNHVLQTHGLDEGNQ
jgi:hypothetical protein